MTGADKNRQGEVPVKQDDPMVLSGGSIQGNPQVMLEGLIEEFARMGHNEERILSLFETPFFLATYDLQAKFGVDHVRQCVREVLSRCGVFRFKTKTTVADKSCEDNCPEINEEGGHCG